MSRFEKLRTRYILINKRKASSVGRTACLGFKYYMSAPQTAQMLKWYNGTGHVRFHYTLSQIFACEFRLPKA
jgi:hypothetical protein